MKIPKRQRRHCKFCNKHTDHRVKQNKNRGRNKTHPMTRYSRRRMKIRGLRRGAGNKGKYSRPAIKSWKMTGKKTSKKTDLRFTCTECKKTWINRKSTRAKRIQLV